MLTSNDRLGYGALAISYLLVGGVLLMLTAPYLNSRYLGRVAIEVMRNVQDNYGPR